MRKMETSELRATVPEQGLQDLARLRNLEGKPVVATRKSELWEMGSEPQ